MAHQGDLIASGCATKRTLALANSLIVTTVQCVYYGFDGNYQGTIPIWYFVFDLAAIPANGTVTPMHVVQVTNSTNSSNFAHGGYTNGEHFNNGIVIVASTTNFPTLTIDTNTQSFIECDFADEYGMYTP
jgi:hypothetical protein